MFNIEKPNLIIKTLGKTLNTDIKFVSLAVTLTSNSGKNNEDREKNVIVCLGLEHLFIFLEDFKKPKALIPYEAIQKITLDKLNIHKVRIDIDTSHSEIKNCGRNFPILLKDRGVFVKSIMCYSSIHYMKKHGTIKEISIFQKEIHNDLDLELNALKKGCGVVHDIPIGFKAKQSNGYE